MWESSWSITPGKSKKKTRLRWSRRNNRVNKACDDKNKAIAPLAKAKRDKNIIANFQFPISNEIAKFYDLKPWAFDFLIMVMIVFGINLAKANIFSANLAVLSSRSNFFPLGILLGIRN
jgi:hypothetical protein